MEFRATLSAEEVDKVFRNLPRATQRRVIMPALRAGAFIVRDMAVANIKSATSGENTGVLQRNIRVYNYRKLRGNYRVGVQVKRGLMNMKVNGKPVRVATYAAVLEYGKNGQVPRSWIRKAGREGVSDAASTIRRQVGIRMDDAVRDAKK